MLLTYYLKVMLLSGLLGLLVRLCLVANLGIPDQGCSLPKFPMSSRLLWVQRLLSSLGLVAFCLVTAGFVGQALLQYTAWEYSPAYM